MWAPARSARNPATMPADGSWCITFEFSSIGYVKDDEKEDIDADEILEEIFYEQDIKAKRIKYSWDDSKLILQKNYYDADNLNFKIDSLFYNSHGQIDYIIPYSYTDFCNCLYNSNIFLLMEYNEQEFLSKLTDYDSTNSHFLTQTFLYDNNNNVEQKYYPLESGLSQYSFEYDAKNSIYQKINLPRIDEISISNNNITRVIVKQQSMSWDDITGDPTYTTSEYELYSSIFTYDSLDYPSQEIRYSSTSIDTFGYKIILVE